MHNHLDEPEEVEPPPEEQPEADDDEYDSESALRLRVGRLGGDACISIAPTSINTAGSIAERESPFQG